MPATLALRASVKDGVAAVRAVAVAAAAVVFLRKLRRVEAIGVLGEEASLAD